MNKLDITTISSREVYTQYKEFTKLSDKDLLAQQLEVMELINKMMMITEYRKQEKNRNSGFRTRAEILAKRLIPETQGEENRTSIYREELQEKIDELPSETQDLLKLLKDFDPRRLRQAFETGLWKQENVQIPNNHEFIRELIFIIKVYWSNLFDDMNKFYDTFYNMQIQRESYDALVNERDTQKCAKIMAGYQYVSFTDEARVNLELSIEKLLDTKEIDRMPPMSQNAVLSFYTTDGRVINFNFTRDMQTLMPDDNEPALLWQATQFQIELLHALIQLSHTPEITIGNVELKTDFNRDYIIKILDPRVQAAVAGIMDMPDK